MLKIEAKYPIDNVELYNVNGQKVSFSTPNSSKAEINMSHLPAGIYILKSTIQGKVTIQKVVKK